MDIVKLSYCTINVFGQRVYSWRCQCKKHTNSQYKVDFNSVCRYLCSRATLKTRIITIDTILMFKMLTIQKGI